MRPRALALAFALAACGKSDDGVVGDRAAMVAVLDADANVAAVLHRADGLVVSGKGKDALALVDGLAREGAEKNAGAADALAPRSRWGKERAEAVKKLTRDRRASVSAYRSALASDELANVVASMEAQKSVEARAMAISSAVREEPTSGCGRGASPPLPSPP